MRDLLSAAAERAIRYLETLDDRSVMPSPRAVAALAQLDEPMPEGPSDPAAVLAMLDDLGSPATMAMAGRRFFGWVIGGSLPATVAATGWPQPGTRTPPAGSYRRLRPPSSGLPCAGCSIPSTCQGIARPALSPGRRWQTSLALRRRGRWW